MKFRWLAGPMLMAAVAAVATLGAVAQTRSMPTPPIGVRVVDGQISVSTEAMRLSGAQTSVAWEMKSAGYRFYNGSINFGDAQGQFNCSAFSGGAGMRCSRTSQDTGRYSYTITLVDENTGAVVDLPQPIIYIQNE